MKVKVRKSQRNISLKQTKETLIENKKQAWKIKSQKKVLRNIGKNGMIG